MVRLTMGTSPDTVKLTSPAGSLAASLCLTSNQG